MMDREPTDAANRAFWPIVTNAAAVLVFVSFAGCTAEPRKFDSADDAVVKLTTAVRDDDRTALRDMFGECCDDLLDSGDEIQDRSNAEAFLAAYEEKHTLVPAGDGTVILEVGAEDWPMPIPIVESKGEWYFDAAAGENEILCRRVGRNELNAIEVCRAIVDAQDEYAATAHDGEKAGLYAQRFISTTGKQDGLYWPVEADEPESPLGALVAEAVDEGYPAPESGTGSAGASGKETRRPFHGYYYRLLTCQGKNAPGGPRTYLVDGKLCDGFAVVAYPVDYRNSGVKTFLVNRSGIVYETDLGSETLARARALVEFDPDDSWAIATELPSSDAAFPDDSVRTAR